MRAIAGLRSRPSAAGQEAIDGSAQQSRWTTGEIAVVALVRRRVALIATPGSAPQRLQPKLQLRRSRSFSASFPLLGGRANHTGLH
jgi:hypothetical protein